LKPVKWNRNLKGVNLLHAPPNQGFILEMAVLKLCKGLKLKEYFYIETGVSLAEMYHVLNLLFSSFLNRDD
jgi:hypothetical protein